MPQFRDSFYELCPPWLRTGVAEKYIYTLELMRDLLMEKSNQAQKIRLPGQGDVSQVPFLAYDRQLEQGPNESTDSFILRLQESFETWNRAGSALAVLGQLQAYTQGIQPSLDAVKFSIVSNPRTLEDASQVNTWWQVDYDDPVGSEPLLSTVPINFDWDGLPLTWRCWLVIYQYRDPPALSGSAASFFSVIGGSFVEPGVNVNGVWVPNTGTPGTVNDPFVVLTGLAGLSSDDHGSIITLSGSANPLNNGDFQIVDVISSTSCVIANPDNVFPDAATVTWSISAYPWMPPALAFGSPDLLWGEGEETTPPVDTGSNVFGVWQPTTVAGAGESPSYSWGVRVSSLEIVSLRNLVKTWKSAGTYYPNIIISYGDDEYSRTSSGTGNPDGTFGSVGHLVSGVWVPTRLLSSPWDCYCQGTGRAVACSLENVT